MELLGMPVHCGHLVCPLWAAQSFPMGPGLGLFTKGFLLLPCPRSALVGLASPWRGRLWAVRPGCASPGVPGVPSVCFLLFSPLFFRFCFVSLLGQRWAQLSSSVADCG